MIFPVRSRDCRQRYPLIFSAGLVQIVCCHIDRGLGALVQAAPGKDHVVVIGRAFQVGNVYRANEGHAILFPQDRLRHLESHKPADGGRNVGDGQLPVVKMAVDFLVRGDPGRPFPLGLPTVIVPVFRTAMIRRDDHQPLLVEPLFPIFDRLPDLGDLLVGFQGIIVEETAVTLNVAGVVGIPQISGLARLFGYLGRHPWLSVHQYRKYAGPFLS